MDCKAPLVAEQDPSSLPAQQRAQQTHAQIQTVPSTDTYVASDSSLLEGLERKLGYTFTDKALLRAALRHRSWIFEVKAKLDCKLLEFMGDGAKQWAVADMLYQRFDLLAEGQLTDLRKRVLNRTSVATLAQSLGIGHLGN